MLILILLNGYDEKKSYPISLSYPFLDIHCCILHLYIRHQA